MTSVVATTSQGAGSPRKKLQILLGVPGYVPNRVNDLLLLRPDKDVENYSEPEEKSNNRHVVFFHGDIQVIVMDRVVVIWEGSHLIPWGQSISDWVLNILII